MQDEDPNTEVPETGAPVVYELSVYTYQIDYMRHVNNTVYIQWMEIGRLALLEAAGMPVSQLAQSGVFPILVETSIRYLKPVVLGDSVRAEVWVSELSQASAWIGFRFVNQRGEVVATGKQRGLFVHVESGRPKRIDAETRAKFRPFLIPEDAANAI